MLERIKYLNDKKIISILNDNHVVQHRTKQEIKNLIDLYKKSNKNEDVYKLIINFDLLYDRDNVQQMNLIQKYLLEIETITNSVKNIEDNKKKNEFIDKKKQEIFTLVTNREILKTRKFKEQVELIDKFTIKEAKVELEQDFQFDIIVNKNILNNLTQKEQLQFLKKYSKPLNNNLFNKINDLLNNEIIFKTRTYIEIDEMLDLYSKLNDEKIYKLITDKSILLNRTYKEQLSLIKTYELLQNENYFNLFVDRDILETRTHNEQINLIKFYVDRKSYDILELVISKSLLRNRTYKEQMTLMCRYLGAVNKEPIFNMLLDENIGKILSYQEQLSMIDDYFRAYDKEIAELDNMKKMLKMLQEQINDKNAKIEILEKEAIKYKKI